MLDLEYVISETYDEPNGRFSLIWGNSAMINCNWVFPEILDSFIKLAYEI